MKKEFWRDWKRKTKLEEAAIKSLKIGKKLILQEIPNSKIHSIYVKGSFVRREMNNKSDVDIVVIVNDNKYIKDIKDLYEKTKGKHKPDMGIGAHSLWELKNNKRFGKSKKLRASPYTFIRQIERYKLIFGKKLNPITYSKKVDDKRYLENRIKTFRNLFIPLYGEKKIGFLDLIKQVFWLVESEERAKSRNPPHNWKKLAKSIKNKNHIVQDSLRLRLKPTKDKKIRERYLRKLEKHLDKLEKAAG